MRTFTDKAIETSLEQKKNLMYKLATLAPTDDLTSDDIRGLMFILNMYEGELKAIQRDRKAPKRISLEKYVE